MTGIYPRRLNVTEAKSPNRTYQVIVRPIMHKEDSKGISENIRWREIYVKAIRLVSRAQDNRIRACLMPKKASTSVQLHPYDQ